LIIIIGIKNNFKKANLVLCGWHIQKNFISRFSKLKREDKDLYRLAISLPFVTSTEKLKNIVDTIEESEYISDNQWEYIQDKLTTKNLWAKCFLKNIFVG